MFVEYSVAMWIAFYFKLDFLGDLEIEMNTIYKMNTEETNSLKDRLKEMIVLKECLCRVIASLLNFMRLKFILVGVSGPLVGAEG